MTHQNGIIIGCPETLWTHWVSLLRSYPAVSFESVVSDDFPDDPDSIVGGMAFARLVVRGIPVEVLAVKRMERHQELIEYPNCLIVQWPRPRKSGKYSAVDGALPALFRLFEGSEGALYLPFRDGRDRSVRRSSAEELERAFK